MPFRKQGTLKQPGVIATVLFYRARHLAKTPMELAGVDATQSTEVLFSLGGEIVFLHGSLPGSAGGVGVALCVVGLVLYIRSQSDESTAAKAQVSGVLSFLGRSLK